MKTKGHKVLITGASEGIGRALASRFSKLGNTVIAVARNKQRLEELTKEYPYVIPFVCDIAKPSELEQLSLFVEQQHPDVSVLINNAGIQYNYMFTDEIHLLNKIDYEVQVNFVAPLKLIALLLPILKQQPEAAIVNVSSGLGLVPKQSAPVYCGTKAGIHIFSKALRYQLQHVRVFEIIPPLVDTNMTKGRGRKKQSPDQLVDEFIQAFERNRYEVNIGKVKLLRLINRIAPAIADRILRKS